MRILDATGDTAVRWSVDDPASIEHAAAVFARQLEHSVPVGRHAGAPAAAARIVTDFDPGLEEVIWTRPVAGG
jgi:hypothetical protein